MDKIWLEHYSKGTPETINPDQYSSLVDLFEKTCAKYSDHIAYTNMGESLTYTDLDQLTQHMAAYLQHCGFKKGDRFAIMLPNVLQYPVMLFAALRAGLVVVNINPLYTAKELTHQLNDADVSGILVLANFAHTVEKALEHVQLKQIIVTELADCFKPFKRLLVNSVVKYVKRMVPHYSLPQAEKWTTVLQQGAKLSFTKVVPASNDVAFLQYTGGTTGVPKGAMLSHRNIVANILQCNAWFLPPTDGKQEIAITPLPLYHVFALTANGLLFFYRGAQDILITNPRDIPALVKEMSQYRFNVFMAVNTLFNALLNNADFAKLDFSGLTVPVGGGMAVQHAVAEKWRQVTGTTIAQGYGLTESSPVVVVNPIGERQFRGSIGLPLPSTDASIRNQQGVELALGEIGELWVKGPQVMLGYWQRDKETKQTITTEGWLKTGDMARMDNEGYIYIEGRIKEMIIVSGFNVYPSEVEDVIVSHPGVVDAGVTGMPDAKAGEAVVAFVIKSEPDLTAQEIIDYCHKELTNYKVPKKVHFVDDLPRSNVGKVLRLALKELL